MKNKILYKALFLGIKELKRRVVFRVKNSSFNDKITDLKDKIT
jgi:hypothetical protein